MATPDQKRAKTDSVPLEFSADQVNPLEFSDNLRTSGVFNMSMSGFNFGEAPPPPTVGSGPIVPPPPNAFPALSFSFPSSSTSDWQRMLADFDNVFIPNNEQAENNASGADAKEESSVLNDLQVRYASAFDELQKLEWDLKNFIPPLPQGEAATLQRRLTDLQGEVRAILGEMDQMLNTKLLLPGQLERWNTIVKQCRLHMAQLDVYRKELKAVVDNKYPDVGVGTLYISEQPFPDVVKQKEKKRTKHSANEDPFEVRLLTGARCGLAVKSKVTAEMVWENSKEGKGKSDAFMSNHSASISKDGVADFAELRFTKGTGVKIVRVRFSCSAKAAPEVKLVGAGGDLTLSSGLSEPFIVMTNESQFKDSAGKLLEQDAFGASSAPISWQRFANLLQLHYLTATRQRLHKIGRPLTRADLAYMWKLKFDQAHQVSRSDYNEFWEWFGKVLHKMRHQKPVPEMWEKGYIFGFIPKNAANEVLHGRPLGTFLVRFSEQSAGQFAVACVVKGKNAGETAVKHYMVPQSTKKLPDYLKTKDAFKSVLCCKTDFRVDTFQEMVKTTLSKEDAFGEFYSTADGAGPLAGYDDLGDDDGSDE